jgi:hypothetical protein
MGRQSQRGIPLDFNPLRPRRQGFVRAGVVARTFTSRGSLPRSRRLTYLSRTNHNLKPTRCNRGQTENFTNNFSFEHTTNKYFLREKRFLLNE